MSKYFDSKERYRLDLAPLAGPAIGLAGLGVFDAGVYGIGRLGHIGTAKHALHLVVGLAGVEGIILGILIVACGIAMMFEDN